jgi:ankyrin repeat and SOCS box protein 13
VNARNIDGATPLCDACSSGNMACVKMMLAYGADVNPKLSFYSKPLHEAVLRGELKRQAVIFTGVNIYLNES